LTSEARHQKRESDRSLLTSAATVTCGLNENHVRHVVTTFRYMDELLSKAEHIMASAGSPSPFQEYSDDTTPLQRKVTHDHVVRLRDLMSRSLEELHIPRPEPVTGALWAARNSVTFSSIALADMESKALRGYGKLPEAAAERIDVIVAELRAAVERLDDYLAHSDGADLQARLQRLDKTSNEVPLLRELERIITAHGLVEFRNVVRMLLERMENGAFEIGVFGRVSSGKSSLLNHLLGGDYLPVGVTPVTAVPTRISFGERPQVRVEFADSRPQVVELSALVDFATEQQNPGNAKHVSRIRVEVPAANLREGITFVDTPGLGSLATGGAEETVAYLPRCDLGIVLVDAASTLTSEDLKVIHALYRAGATVMVLVSKADVLSTADRERAVVYVRKQVRAEVNVEPGVHPVSVVGADAKLCDEWFESHLRPLLDAHRELMTASLRRKVGGLREALLTTLKRRTEIGAPALSADTEARVKEVTEELRTVSRMLESKRREIEEQARSIRDVMDSVIEIVADELAGAWLARDSQGVNPAERFTATVSRLVTEESAKVGQRVEKVRAWLDEMVQTASRLLPSARLAIQELPRVAGLPFPDASALTGKVNLRRPRTSQLFGRTVLRRHIQKELSEQAWSELRDFLSDYSQRLTQWAKSSLAELEAAYSANAGIFQAQLARRNPAETGPPDSELRKDILLLEQWERRKTPLLEPVS
jgi:GTP-binding protein EngB required for normal cell division